MSAFRRLVPAEGSARARFALLAQLLGTAAILGWLPGNLAKLAAMGTIWSLGFGRLTVRELLMMAAVNLLFAAMNLAALGRGIFVFDDPDFLGMPVYEYLMWGFYTLHTIRLLDGPAPRQRGMLAALAAAVFAAPFATIADPGLLLAVSAALLAGGLALFHDRMDFAYCGYMAALGTVIERVGVSTGQWHYPGQLSGNIPWWSLIMWAGIGLFTRRLVIPLAGLGRHDRTATF